MNKIFSVSVGVIILLMAATPLVMAQPWEPKNNPKFETFYVNQQSSLAPYLAALANAKYIPAEENPNLLIIGPYEDQQIASGTINVGDNTYVEGIDYEYTGMSTYQVWRPTGDFFAVYPLGDLMMFKVEYMYDFEDDGEGIDGTIRMRATWLSDDFFSFVTPGSFKITSLEGTGDLQNVNIKATNTVASVGSAHLGIVIGWPE
jgi:hypothetical protein